MILSFGTLLSDYRSSFLKLTTLGFAQAAGHIATAFVVQQIFDSFLAGQNQKPALELPTYAVILVIVALLSGAFSFLERTWSESLGQVIVHDLRIKMFRHLTKVYPRVMEQKNKGGLHLRLVNDLTAVRQWVTLGLSRILVSGISIVLTISALAYINLMLAGFVFFFVAAGALAAFFIGPCLKIRVSNLRKRRARLANNVGEKIDALQTVQAFGREKSEIKKMTRLSQALVRSALSRAQMIGFMRGGIIALTGFATMSILITGSYLVGIGQTTPGVVAAAMSIVGFLIPPLRGFGRTYEYWVSYNVAAEKIEQTLSLERAKLKGKGRSKAQDLDGKIEYKNIRVAGVFDSFSAKALPGEKIVIVGPNGAGKTTLFSVLLGIIKPDDGELLIDGRDLKKWNIRSLRSHIGIVSSDMPLIRGSLRKNILYRHKRVNDRALQNAMVLSGLSDRLDQFPEGLDTKIAERGKGISSGERQTLALTRALLGMPDILLLDEAETNLDEEAKEIICKIISTYPGTVLIITHDPSLKKLADAVWELPQKTDLQRKVKA